MVGRKMVITLTPHNVQRIVFKNFHTVIGEEIVNPDRVNSSKIVSSAKRPKNKFGGATCVCEMACIF
jgi:hypothetical protein